LVAAVADAGPTAVPIAQALLRGLASLEKLPALDPASTAVLKRLLDRPATAASTLQLAAQWDRAGALTATTTAVIAQMFTDLSAPATSDVGRSEIAESLLALPSQRANALAKISALLSDAAGSPALKNALVTTLGDTRGADTAAALAAYFAQSKSTAAFDAVLRRPESVSALLAVIRVGRLTVADFDTGQLSEFLEANGIKP
jgi:hypothetical protein